MRDQQDLSYTVSQTTYTFYDHKKFYFDEELGILREKKFRRMGRIKRIVFTFLYRIIEGVDLFIDAYDWIKQSWNGTLHYKRRLDGNAVAHLKSHFISTPILLYYWNWYKEVNYVIEVFVLYFYYKLIWPIVKICIKIYWQMGF